MAIVLRDNQPEDIRVQSRAVAARLSALPCMASLPPGAAVSVYLPMAESNNEVDTWPLAEMLSARNVKLVIPLITGKGAVDMCMASVPTTDTMGELRSLPLDKWNIPVPKKEWVAEQPGVEADIAVILVPCVALGQDGRRLGHGKGYYDAFLARVTAERAKLHRPAPVSVGLALRAQLLPAGYIPVGDWDQPLDMVVSPDGVWPADRA